MKTTLDGLGRPLKVEQFDSGGVLKSTVETKYAPCGCTPVGKVWKVSQPYAPGGTVTWTEYSYDALGRTVSVTQPGNSGTTGYVYAGNTVKVTDPAGNEKKLSSSTEISPVFPD